MASTKFLQTLALGTIAGIRSGAAPTIVSEMIHKSAGKSLGSSRLSFLDSAPARIGLKIFSAAEMAGDKTSLAPDRIRLPQLLARGFSGALAGAALYRASGASAGRGALIGGLTAIAATYATFYLRKEIKERAGVADSLLGGIEDAVVLYSGLALRKFG